MTFGSMPYTGMTNKETMNYVMRGGRLSRPGICPEPVYKPMGSCCKTNPQTRPTFEYIRNKLRLFIQVSSFHTITSYINYRHTIIKDFEHNENVRSSPPTFKIVPNTFDIRI